MPSQSDSPPRAADANRARELSPDLEREIRRFSRRVRVGRFLGGAAQALAVTAVACAGALVVLRLLGVAWLPQPAWFALLLVPAFLWGLRAVSRSGFDRNLSAAHLDRRLGLDGLLIASLERDPQGYRVLLTERLHDARAALPHIRLRPMLLRVGVAAAVIAVLFLLPPPAPHSAQANPIVAEALEEFEARLEAQEGLQEETREELASRFDEMQEQFRRDGDVSWTDLDNLERRLEHERANQVAQLSKTMQDLAAFAKGEDQEAQAGEGAARDRMGELLREAKDAGLLDKLPPGLLERLGQGAGDGQQAEGVDGQGLGASDLDAEALAQLAAALADSAGEALEALDAAELAGELELADLAEMLEGEACKLCAGEPEEGCPG